MKKMNAERQIRNEKCEHHSNLALVSVVVAMVTFVVLMFVYMGDHNPARVEMVVNASKYLAAGCWITSAVFAITAVRRKRKYLLEYLLVFLVLGFGLFYMYDMPNWVYEIIKNTTIAYNWAKAVFRALAIGLGLYTVVSIVWHGILATPKKAGKGKK